MAVLLKGRNGNELELAFIRESLPPVQDDHGDAAWCTINVRAATADTEWEESAPCLNPYEFQTLADWLDALGRGAEGQTDSVEILESELKFSISAQRPDGVAIRIGFHLTDRPEEFGVDAPTDEADSIDLFMERPNIRAAAAALRDSLRALAPASKDDTDGDSDPGAMGQPDENLNLVDRIEKNPPGAGRGEDNAANR